MLYQYSVEHQDLVSSYNTNILVLCTSLNYALEEFGGVRTGRYIQACNRNNQGRKNLNEILWLIAITGLIVVFFIVVLYLILRRSGDEGEVTTGGGPLDVLYDRFVQGEITIDQYRDQRKEVQEHTPENVLEKFSRYL